MTPRAAPATVAMPGIVLGLGRQTQVQTNNSGSCPGQIMISYARPSAMGTLSDTPILPTSLSIPPSWQTASPHKHCCLPTASSSPVHQTHIACICTDNAPVFGNICPLHFPPGFQIFLQTWRIPQVCRKIFLMCKWTRSMELSIHRRAHTSLLDTRCCQGKSTYPRNSTLTQHLV